MGPDAKTVLVVDDEPDVAIYLVTLLEDNGYQVMEARNADEAKKRLEMKTPDLITLDIMMPRRSGIAFYRELKQDRRFKDIPVIFITAFGQARDFTGPAFRRLAPEEEVPEPEAFLEKPIQPERMIALVRAVMGP
jgi:twitching motility two-component system response regulator PilH